MTDWSYDAWASGEPYQWGENARTHPDDRIDFHVDIGCGLVKKGRIGVDRHMAPGVNVLTDFEEFITIAVASSPNRDVTIDPDTYGLDGLPFDDSSIESMIAHHVLEHVGDGFTHLLDECWRVLKPDAKFRIIVPLFPSHSALADPDHRRLFVEGTFEHMLMYEERAFAVPYLESRWRLTAKDVSPPTHWTRQFTVEDRREMRVTLEAEK